MRARAWFALAAVVAAVAPVARAAAPVASPDRSVEPVVLSGQQFPTWSAGPDITLREPQVADDRAGHKQSACSGQGSNPYDPTDTGDHNCYQPSRIPQNPRVGADVNKLLGYRWDARAKRFVQIPFQVDERWTRYLTNNASGFAFYSAADQETTYAWDREGFRYTGDQSEYAADGNPCLSEPARVKDANGNWVKGPSTTADPVKGLDDNDELAFMASDAGSQAPAGTPLPKGIANAYEVTVADPADPAHPTFAYVMLANSDGPKPAFDASNGYVRYVRDANADMFAYSQSSYGDYGAAPKGPYCDPATGALVTDATGKPKIGQRRPLDGAWVKTPRYWFRYDGRWLLTQLRISPNDSGLSKHPKLGPDIIDQWKARAFQQRPGGTTPCCGYEEEVNNWGGSSILFGERVGPVRVIRAAWGADSSTNNIKTEVFYRDTIRFQDNLRVHVIPPFDGIYQQWDYNAGKVSTYYNPINPNGVPIDGRDDEALGNSYLHLAQDRIEVQDGTHHVVVPLAGGDPNSCSFAGQDGICNDVDFPDPSFSGPLASLNWEEVAGPNGSVVTRWTVRQHTAGDAYSLLAMPYYRDDSCFDDGTGSDPGPHLRGRSVDRGPARADHNETWQGDASTYLDPATGTYKPRVCWKPSDGDPAKDPAGPRKYWQGDIGTQGLHLELIVDSDNAAQTEPIDEIDSEQRMVVLSGNPGNVGDRYGRSSDVPLILIARPF
ncbi:MAG: hypothetical protein ACXVQ5_12240 [Actinomycetota bacterium]